MDGLAGRAVGGRRQRREPAQVDLFAAIEAFAVAAVLQAPARGDHLLELVGRFSGLGLLDHGLRFLDRHVLEVDDLALADVGGVFVQVAGRAQDRPQLGLTLGQQLSESGRKAAVVRVHWNTS